ncbi:PAS sensor protein [Gemmatirosa kalamazoonensis]|uniref:histidine kinase n=1 Tax=Gemmatirosa kalamazoonensis TaxID=861299 RepID=W0RC27_9BACT|nr:MEDS domain-containing protein [Gemmatirosa kalamazoonensis]AHG87870.1 PAS sensor protein [Gemmatirosa kalamazoonensis]
MTMQPIESGSSHEPAERFVRRRDEHAPGHRHAVQFYERDDFLARVVSDFVSDGLAAGEPALIIATAAHRAAITRALAATHDVDALQRRGDLRLLDAQAMLDTFMEGGVPDPARFREVVGAAIARLAHGRPRAVVRAYGEMVDVLWGEENVHGALRLEALWNELASTHHFTLLCAYAMARFGDAAQAEAFAELCAAHDHVVPAETYPHADATARQREIARLQQRAAALEAEVARRERLERQLRAELAARERAEAAVRASEQELKDFLENAAEGIHFVAADGTILWANRAELELLGCTREQYLGRSINDFHADAHVIADILARLRRGETLHNRAARLRRPDGEIRHVLINSNCLWRDGELQYTRCFTRDVTELHAAETEREALLARAEALRREAEGASQAKSAFLAMMSHELRTPLNAIGGHVQLMELGIHGPLTDAQRDALDRVQRSQRHLLSLVNDVLNLARVESGRIEYDAESLPLESLLAEMRAMVEPLLEGGALTCEVGAAADATNVYADREKVQQIVLNLLTNAIKFTPAGGRITLESGVDGDAAVVRVRDTGIGIPANRLESVFEPFVQIGARAFSPQEGVGLGLAISRNLARGMRGDLTVESTVGEGSCFTLRLPLA